MVSLTFRWPGKANRTRLQHHHQAPITYFEHHTAWGTWRDSTAATPTLYSLSRTARHFLFHKKDHSLVFPRSPCQRQLLSNPCYMFGLDASASFHTQPPYKLLVGFTYSFAPWTRSYELFKISVLSCSQRPVSLDITKFYCSFDNSHFSPHSLLDTVFVATDFYYQSLTIFAYSLSASPRLSEFLHLSLKAQWLTDATTLAYFHIKTPCCLSIVKKSHLSPFSTI